MFRDCAMNTDATNAVAQSSIHRSFLIQLPLAHVLSIIRHGVPSVAWDVLVPSGRRWKAEP